jgi:hypothetical protein
MVRVHIPSLRYERAACIDMREIVAQIDHSIYAFFIECHFQRNWKILLLEWPFISEFEKQNSFEVFKSGPLR